MKKKFLAVLLTLFPFFALGVTAQADTVKIVSDTAYAPFEFPGLRCSCQCGPSRPGGCHHGWYDQDKRA